MLKSTIKLSPFSTKQKLYLYFGFKATFCVAEGSVRSGKSIMDCLLAADYLDKCEDTIHLASGSTVASAETIIGDCNGFGLAHLFKGRCEWGKFRQNEALYISTATGGNKAMISKERKGNGNYNKVIIFVGGGKADSFRHIRGYSIGLWIATEIDLHYDSEDSRTSFVKNALDRQIAAIDPKTIWDFNPCDPRHPIYKYVDGYKKTYIGGYAYIHTILTDNLSLTPERIKRITATHDKNSIWYKRDVLGQRCVAEGLIYNFFNNHIDKFKLPDNHEIHADVLYGGVDFGGNKSATTFEATYVSIDRVEVITILDERIKESLNPTSLYDRFKSFVHRLHVLYPKVKIFKVRCDSAESNLIQGMKILAMSITEIYVEILYAWKIAINDRIRFFDGIQSTLNYHYLERCTETRDAFAGAAWDPKKTDERLDVTSYDNPIDILDATEYSIEPLMKQITEAQLYVQQ